MATTEIYTLSLHDALPIYSTHNRNGAVAQLGERIVRNDEARGSIPLGSTTQIGRAHV